MNWLKISTRHNPPLQNLVQIVDNYSQDIEMNSGVDKSAKSTKRRGKLSEVEEMKLVTNTKIWIVKS